GYTIDRVGIGPEDLRQSRLIAGSAVARLDKKTAIAFGFAEGAKAMERRLTGANAGSFLIASDISGTPGFAAKRNSSMAVRHKFGGGWTTTLSARRGWTDFAGGQFQTDAYALDVNKLHVLSDQDGIGFRLSQPLRIDHGGVAMMLPTAYDYVTETATNSLSR